MRRNKKTSITLEKIKQESPGVYKMIKDIQNIKWEIARGKKFGTTDRTSSVDENQRLSGLLDSYNV